MTTDTDMISRAEADRQTQEAVAAALMEAVGKVNEACDGSLSLQSRSDEDCAYDDGVREGCAAATHAIRALIPDTDMISRAEADRQTQEAVAAALMEAAEIARAAPDGEVSYDDILALIPDERTDR